MELERISLESEQTKLYVEKQLIDKYGNEEGQEGFLEMVKKNFRAMSCCSGMLIVVYYMCPLTWAWTMRTCRIYAL